MFLLHLSIALKIPIAKRVTFQKTRFEVIKDKKNGQKKFQPKLQVRLKLAIIWVSQQLQNANMIRLSAFSFSMLFLNYRLLLKKRVNLWPFSFFRISKSISPLPKCAAKSGRVARFK